jgi:hypothetical protein
MADEVVQIIDDAEDSPVPERSAKRVKRMVMTLDGKWEEDEVDSEEAKELGIRRGDSDSEDEPAAWSWMKAPPPAGQRRAGEVNSGQTVTSTANQEKAPGYKFSQKAIDAMSWDEKADLSFPTAERPLTPAQTQTVQRLWGDLEAMVAEDFLIVCEALSDHGSGDADALEGVPADIANSQANLSPTKILVLFPMFNTDFVNLDVYTTFFSDVHADVARECGQYGTVLQVWINPTSQGDVWVQFADTVAASKAQRALHGRWFAGQQITAEYASEETFQKNLTDCATHPLG